MSWSRCRGGFTPCLLELGQFHRHVPMELLNRKFGMTARGVVTGREQDPPFKPRDIGKMTVGHTHGEFNSVNVFYSSLTADYR